MWPFDDILSSLNNIYLFFCDLADLLLYLPERSVQFIEFLIGLALDIPLRIYDLIVSFVDIFTGIVTFVLSIIPINIFGLYMLVFALIVFIRVYQIISDIQVLGFKL